MSLSGARASGGRSFQNLLCFVIFALYMLSSLLLVAIGVRAYRSVVVSGADTEILRSSLGYVAAKMRALDFEGQAYIDTSADVDSLVLPGDIIDGERFITRIYWYEGALYELYMLSGIDFLPETGVMLMPVQAFTMTRDARGAFRFTAYAGDGEARSLTMTPRTQAEGVS